MPDILPELLKPRTILILHAIAKFQNSPEWWGKYDKDESLWTGDWSDTKVDYRRPDHKSATVMLTNVQPTKIKDSKESDPVELDSRIIDAASIEVLNKTGQSPRAWRYSGEFEKLVTKAESFELGFEQSLETTYTAGNDASMNKLEIKASLGFSQTTTTDESTAERESRVFEFSGETPIGVNEKITAWRRVSKLQSVITGFGDYEHSIRIGKHWHGSWQGGSHSWDTFADFLRVLRGEAPTSYDLANEFRKNPGAGMDYQAA